MEQIHFVYEGIMIVSNDGQVLLASKEDIENLYEVLEVLREASRED